MPTQNTDSPNNAKTYNPNAVWISHSALAEFYSCPKSYYFRYIYRNSFGQRIEIASPYLTLGNLVHDTIKYYFNKEAKVDLKDLFWYLDFRWKLKSSKAGGFKSPEEEVNFKNNGTRMITCFYENITRLNLNPEVPKFLECTLIEEGDVRLCGSADLYDLLPNGSLHLIDFKTNKQEEPLDSLQLPIYAMLAEKCLGKKVAKTSYWYLNNSPNLKEVPQDGQDHWDQIREKAQVIMKARSENTWDCLKGKDGCFKCSDYDLVVKGLAPVVGTDKNRTVYFVDRTSQVATYSSDLPF